MLTDLPQFYLPNLYTFQNKNTFYGSLDELRFRVQPRIGAEDMEDALVVCVWTGEYALEDSVPFDESAFPLDGTGYQQLLDWLEVVYQQVHRSTQVP